MANTRSTRLSCIFALICCTHFLVSSENRESDDSYVFRAIDNTDLVLDAADPKQLKIQRYTGADTQLWKFQPAGRPSFYFIINKHDGKVLDFEKRKDGNFIAMVGDLHNHLQQKWMLHYDGRIVNAATGKNLDIHRADVSAGNELIMVGNNGCSCQEFLLEKKV